MAPTTRSKASNTANVPAAVAPAPPTKATGGKTKKAKTPKRPAAAAAAKPKATPSKVQKKHKKTSPKNKKGKGKNRKSSAETSVKSSSEASPRASSKSSLKSSLKKPTGTKSPRPAHATVQDDFPELAQVLPFLDQDDLQPAAPSRSPLRRRTDHVLRPDLDVLMDQVAHHSVNVPAWSKSRPGTSNSNSSAISGLGNYLPKGFELAESPPPVSAGHLLERDRSISPHVRSPAHDRRRREARRSGSSVVRDIVSQVESQSSSETPVDVKNAHVFKRPTVADVRRERQLMHDELRDWVGRMKRARDDFNAVIEEMEGRMQIIKAVNRMQAPLRKATLGRGR